jgi:hypothetical protein
MIAQTLSTFNAFWILGWIYSNRYQPDLQAGTEDKLKHTPCAGVKSAIGRRGSQVEMLEGFSYGEEYK